MLLLELLLNLLHIVFKHLGLFKTYLDLILQSNLLLVLRIHLLVLLLRLVTDLVALVLLNDALTANVGLARLTEVLGLLLRMQEAELLQLILLGLFLSMSLVGSWIGVGRRLPVDRRTNSSELVILLVVDIV